MGLTNNLNRALSIHTASRLLSGSSVLDKQWQADVFRNWAGLSVFQQVTKPLINKLSLSKQKQTKSIAQDLGKTLTVIAISTLLENSKLLWSRVLIVIIGTMLYHLIVKDYIVVMLRDSINESAVDWMVDWGENLLILSLTDFAQGEMFRWKDTIIDLVGLGVYYMMLKH